MTKSNHRCEDPRCWRADGTHSKECCHNTLKFSITPFSECFGTNSVRKTGKYVQLNNTSDLVPECWLYEERG